MVNEFDLLKTICQDLSIIEEYEISKDVFYKDKSIDLFSKMEHQLNNGFSTYTMNDTDKAYTNSGKVLDKSNIKGYIKKVQDNTARYKSHDILNSGIDRIINKDIDIYNTIGSIKEAIEEVEYMNEEISDSVMATDYPEMYRQESIEMENSDTTFFYTLKHPIFKKYVRMKKGWNCSIIGRTGDGKSLNACMISVDFVEMYDEDLLFVTDENDKETILLYMKCYYFGLHFRSIQDRTAKLDEYIDNLSKEKKEEYDRIFSKIQVWELSGIPSSKIKRYIKSSNKKFGMLMIDSFDEVDSLSNTDEITRYDKNAKTIEIMAKELDLILIVTAQTKTDYYSLSAEKVPLLANFNSKTLVKKNFLSILIHSTYNKDGDKIDNVIKLNKCRSGGDGIMIGYKKNYDYINIIAENKEYDIARIKNKNKVECDF